MKTMSLKSIDLETVKVNNIDNIDVKDNKVEVGKRMIIQTIFIVIIDIDKDIIESQEKEIKKIEHKALPVVSLVHINMKKVKLKKKK